MTLSPSPRGYMVTTVTVTIYIYLTGATYTLYGYKLYTLLVQPIYFPIAIYILSCCNLYTFLLQSIYLGMTSK